MRFGLIIRGQYPQGDDMRVRLRKTSTPPNTPKSSVLT